MSPEGNSLSVFVAGCGQDLKDYKMMKSELIPLQFGDTDKVFGQMSKTHARKHTYTHIQALKIDTHIERNKTIFFNIPLHFWTYVIMVPPRHFFFFIICELLRFQWKDNRIVSSCLLHNSDSFFYQTDHLRPLIPVYATV